MAERVPPPLTHDGQPYGQVVYEISTTAINLRSRLPALIAIAVLGGCIALAASQPPLAVIYMIIICASAALLIFIGGAPRLFMKSGYVRRYVSADKQGQIWLIEDKPTTRIALPVNDGLKVVEHYHGAYRHRPEISSRWSAYHPAAVHQAGKKNTTLSFLPQEGPAVAAALRNHLPDLVVERRINVDSGAA